jgi:orotate phosphoribosyltransferase
VVEELVNFGETTTNSLNMLRTLGFVGNQAATLLHYDHAEANNRLAANGITLTHLTTLPNLLAVAVENGHHTADAVASYKEFLQDPAEWQRVRGIQPKEV